MKTRKKPGTQSCPCPVTVRKRGQSRTSCGASSRVVRTTLVDEVTVRRRQCERGHHFTTEEKPSES
jgi:hypothetical protein